MLKRRPSFSCTAETLVEGVPVAVDSNSMMPGGARPAPAARITL